MKQHVNKPVPPKDRMMVGIPNEDSDIMYSTGFSASDPVVVFFHENRRFLVVSDMELGRAMRQARTGITVETPDRLQIPPERRRDLGAWACAIAKRYRVQHIAVPWRFPTGVGKALEQDGVKVMPVNGPFIPERAVKRSNELQCIHESQQAAVIAFRAASGLIASAEIDAGGVLKVQHHRLTSEQVRERIEKVLFEHGCEGRDIIVAGGVQGADPHETGSGPLRAGEPIVIDIFPKHRRHGYWGDLTRTVVRGKPAPMAKKMYRAVRAAQMAALRRLHAGVHAASVHHAAVRELERHGFVTGQADGLPTGFFHSTGHGVGLSIHESPAIGNTSQRLKAGHVVTIEPGLYYPHIGGVRIEDTVVITPTGWKYLAPCEHRFEL